jgi:hypothetical protein
MRAVIVTAWIGPVVNLYFKNYGRAFDQKVTGSILLGTQEWLPGSSYGRRKATVAGQLVASNSLERTQLQSTV